MAQPLVITLINQFRRELAAQDKTQASEMASRWLDIERFLEDEIFEVSQEIFELRADNPEASASRLRTLSLRNRRLQALLGQIRAEIDRFLLIAENQIDQAQFARAAMGIDNGITLINSVGVNVAFNRLNTAAVENIVAIARAGKPLAEILAPAGQIAAEKMINILVRGTALGWNPRKTAKAIIKDGLSQGLNHIMLVARDQQNRAYREANRQQYQESGVVVQYKRLAAKDQRTCLACLALDGTIYDTDELMELHPQDRCAMVPVLVGEKPISFKTGEQWFNEQKESVQKKMMGDGRFKAWKEGKFEFSDLASVKQNRIWGPSARVTPLKELV